MITAPSSRLVHSSWIEKVARRTIPLVDYSFGPVTIGDPEGGVRAVQYVFDYADGAIRIRVDEQEDVLWSFPVADVTGLSGCFDQQGQPVLTYRVGTTWTLRTFESNTWVTRTLASGVDFPRVLFDKETGQSPQTADVVVAYIRANALYLLFQRELYATEHKVEDITGNATLVHFGHNSGFRIQWKYVPRS